MTKNFDEAVVKELAEVFYAELKNSPSGELNLADIMGIIQRKEEYSFGRNNGGAMGLVRKREDVEYSRDEHGRDKLKLVEPSAKKEFVVVETMSLVGGINQYMFKEGESRYISQEPPYGRKVKFLNKNGWDSDREKARQFFEEGQILTVNEIYVSRSSSNVEFVELPNKRFNTTMFADV